MEPMNPKYANQFGIAIARGGAEAEIILNFDHHYGRPGPDNQTIDTVVPVASIVMTKANFAKLHELMNNIAKSASPDEMPNNGDTVIQDKDLFKNH